MTVVGLTWPCCHTLLVQIVPLAVCERLHFSPLLFHGLEMCFCLSNREINCPVLALAAHLIFSFYVLISLGKRICGHKETNCSVSFFLERFIVIIRLHAVMAGAATYGSAQW